VNVRQARRRSPHKRTAILDAARELFLARGYGGVTMDDIAASAVVSKQTVYSHFGDKQRLFAEVITADIAAAESGTHDLVEALVATSDLPRDLLRFARQHVEDVMQPHLLRMRRMLIAEAETFPELARTWYASGPEQGHATLAKVFKGLGDRRLLRVPDPLLAAQHFNWLVLSIPLTRAMFITDEPASQRELRRYADEAVRVFLAAYGA
jgi:TetR/AcrR family transcriptional repressor of mexJK operon